MGDMHKGMKTKSPPAMDASRAAPKQNINKDATRSSTAKNQASLGPRSA